MPSTATLRMPTATTSSTLPSSAHLSAHTNFTDTESALKAVAHALANWGGGAKQKAKQALVLCVYMYDSYTSTVGQYGTYPLGFTHNVCVSSSQVKSRDQLSSSRAAGSES